MTQEQWWGAALFMVVSSVTPGPNNTMLMASGVHFGFKRTLPHLMGVQLGFGFMLFSVGMGLHAVLEQVPAFYELVRFAGVAYMAWMAYKLATAQPQVPNATMDDESPVALPVETRPMGFFGAVLFQWVNPKAWVMAVTIMGAYPPPGAGPGLIGALGIVYVALGLPCSSVWVGFGSALRIYLQDAFRMRVFNCTMAAALLASLYPMLQP